MMRRTLIAGMGLALATLVGAGCSSTSMVNTWQAPKPQTAVRHVLVVAMAPDEGLRRTAEDDLAKRLGDRGVQVSRSSEFVASLSDLSPEKMPSLVQQTGADAVLVTELLGVDREPRYVPPTVGWYGYYRGAFPTVYSSGFYSVDRVVNVSTRLFSTGPNSDLMWSALSRTHNPSSPRQGVASVSKAVVNNLEKSGLI
jgi:hypothetical protein